MKRSKIMKLVIAGLLIAFGAAAMIKPDLVYGVINYLLGIGLMANGLVLILEFFSIPKEIKDRYYQLVGGLAFVAAGVALLIIPIGVIQVIIGLFVAIGLLLIGLFLISRALLERRHYDGWVIRLLIGIITLIGSLLVFSKLGDTSDAIARIIGGVAIYIGINNLLGAVLLKPRSKDDPDKIDIDFTKK
ncbi:MAG: DUF308 domain-containing protein [Bacilli bacterium]|jgi:uncharacterized membrane protein HdeD (DUF308 family)